MRYLADLELRMYNLEFNEVMKSCVFDLIDSTFMRFSGFNRETNISKLVLYFAGNSEKDRILIQVPNRMDKAVLVMVYRNGDKYQTHVFEGIKELQNKVKDVRWWRFDPLDFTYSRGI